ncbi:MAG: protoporphyrinogen oxidase [Verrucomicrobiota bacterium]
MSGSNQTVRDLVVIGGGITGLAAAFTAGSLGKSVTLLESGPRFGGSVVTYKEGGYVVEGGPHSFLVDQPEQEEFLKEAGLWDEAIESSPVSRKRFVVRKGKVTALPTSPGSFIMGSFLSISGKLRLMAEPLLHGSAPEGEEAIGPWSERHFGREVRRGLVDPFVSGIFAGDPEKISLSSAFPKLFEIAEEHPSLFRAFLKRQKGMREKGESRFPRRMISFADGLGQMTEHLVREGSFGAIKKMVLQKIEKAPHGWAVTFSLGSDTDPTTIHCRNLLVAVPPTALGELPFEADLHEDLRVFQEVECPPVSTLSIGYRREDISHPLDGFGVLAPKNEQRKILGILFDSSLFENRAPEGEVLVSAFLGGVRSPEAARESEESMLKSVTAECRDLLGARGEPTFWKATFWPRAIPQYNLGFRSITAVLDSLEDRTEGLAFAGNARDGVSLGACLLSGIRRARGLLLG